MARFSLVFIESWTGRWYARYAGTYSVIATADTLAELIAVIEEEGL